MHNDSESEIEEGPLSEYEKQRLENVERNKKRFQEMNLSSFDQFLQAKKKETENKKSVSNFYDSDEDDIPLRTKTSRILCNMSSIEERSLFVPPSSSAPAKLAKIVPRGRASSAPRPRFFCSEGEAKVLPSRASKYTGGYNYGSALSALDVPVARSGSTSVAVPAENISYSNDSCNNSDNESEYDPRKDSDSPFHMSRDEDDFLSQISSISAEQIVSIRDDNMFGEVISKESLRGMRNKEKLQLSDGSFVSVENMKIRHKEKRGRDSSSTPLLSLCLLSMS